MTKEYNNLFDVLLDHQIATEEEIRLVSYINGHNLESLESILSVRCGYGTLSQYKECELEAFE